MKIFIGKPGFYELTLVEELTETPEPPVVVPEPPTPTPSPSLTPIIPSVTPIPPKPSPLPDFTQRLSEALTSTEGWSKPEVVWEFEELAGGAFIPLNETENLQQNREGGSIRWHKPSGRTKPKVYDLKGNRVEAFISDAKYFDKDLYAVFKVEEEIYLGRLKSNDSNFYLFRHVPIDGAKDTSHSLEVISHTDFNVYGRLRSVDWEDNDPVLKDRRGVRLVTIRGNTVKSQVLFDPAETQPSYRTNKMKYDFYSTRHLKVKGLDLYQISCFSKNRDRVPSTRPERITGTGPIYPIFAIGNNILSHTKTNVDLSLHSRRSEWKEAQPYEPEVGQVYGYGMTYENGILTCYYSHRFDTHYLVDPDTASRMPNCKIYKIQIKI